MIARQHHIRNPLARSTSGRFAMMWTRYRGPSRGGAGSAGARGAQDDKSEGRSDADGTFSNFPDKELETVPSVPEMLGS
jgi:hypothetical protein